MPTPRRRTAANAAERASLELFDLEKGPHTVHNVADDGEHEDVLQRMLTELRVWADKTDNKALIGEEPPEAQRGAWVVPLGLKLAKGQYDVVSLPTEDKFRDMLK